MSLPYTALHTFHLAVRFGNLKQTADHLNLTESAVSHQIKRLEAQLGYALFYKSGRQLKTTPEGTHLAQELAHPFDHIDQTLSNTKRQAHNTITIYCLPSLIELWLLPKLLTFKQHYPEYNLIIRYHSSSPDYLDEHCLRVGSHEKESHSPYLTHTLFSAETIPVCSPIYLSQHAELSDERRLRKADLLHDHSEASWFDWFLKQGLSAPPSSKVLYEDFHLLKMATLAAQGVALCPEILIQQDLKSGALIALSSQKGNIGRYYAIEQNRYAHSNVRLLIDHLGLDQA